MGSALSRTGVTRDVCSWRQPTGGVLWRLVCCLYTPLPRLCLEVLLSTRFAWIVAATGMTMVWRSVSGHVP